MRYFTRGWANGELPEAEAEKTPKAYWKHVEDLLPGMPAGVAKLAKTNLHDALISRACLDTRTRTLTLVLLVWARTGRSCSEVTLRYAGVETCGQNIETLKARARDRESEILYDEIDSAADGSWVHRLLFWPEGEISIWFRRLSVRRARKGNALLSLKPYFQNNE